MSKHKQHRKHDHAEKEDGPMILDHAAVDGYRPIFYICITIGILYLAFVFWRTW
ncbi:MAG: hypothetical protein IBX47_00050 [Desulfuromonadales bacterium]|jgi:hypothetical protein|nr:hypothetical protein [Desulfuromonadales bacterium]